MQAKTHTTATGQTLKMNYDGLRRLTGVTGGVYDKTYTYRDVDNTKTTMQIASVAYDLPTNLNYSYTYDNMGNIATYTDVNGTVTYTYDAQGQLLSATDGTTTYSYTYDTVGNILAANGHTYTYGDGDSDWKDLLTAIDGETISYDDAGNPTSYYNGTRWTFGWEQGRRLTTATDGTTNLSFTYDADGLRTSKIVDGVKHTYIYASGKLLRETYGDTTIDFFYDASGNAYALKYNGTTYYYITNLQGDVMSIVDAQGAVVASYEYDPYGNVTCSDDDLAEINPLRYRGYYYDGETGMYYLQSRYYDPELGRFINADAFASTGQGILGNNMFAYCGNNPVSRIDSTGSNFRCAVSAICLDAGGGTLYDYVIYYSHPKSSKNLEDPARRNHSTSESIFVAAGSFEELVNAINRVPGNTDDVFIYMHSDENNLSFYYAQYYSAENIKESFNEIDIYGDIYLFSCKGGRGKLASTMASTTNCTVIASVYKVSFGNGFARCGWENYVWDVWDHGAYSWYSYYPDGSKEAVSYYWIYTQ